MKNFRYILFAVFAFAALSCDSNDDGFYNTKYVNASNLVTVATQPDYDVNDLLYIDATIPNLLPEEGFSNLLDVRRTTGNASSFNFSFILEKQVATDVWEVVDLSQDVLVTHGAYNVGSFVEAILQYDVEDEQYVFSGGIRLTEPGTYRFGFSINSASTERVALRSNSAGNNLVLHVFSSTNIPNASEYIFTVD